MRVRGSGDLIHWIRFFLKGVEETATKGRDTFQKILALRTEAEQHILGLGKRAPNAQRALNLLYRRPVVTASDLERELAISTPAANALIRDLMKLEIVTEITGRQKGRVYAFGRYLSLFLS